MSKKAAKSDLRLVINNPEAPVTDLVPASAEQVEMPFAMVHGEPVTLEGYPRSDGTAEMRIERITAGGKTVELR